jgi:hypothetical protein
MCLLEHANMREHQPAYPRLRKDDEELMKIKAQIGENKAPEYRVDQYGILWFKKRLCVPEQDHYRNTIMDEAHNSTYSIHPGATKLYVDLREKC